MADLKEGVHIPKEVIPDDVDPLAELRFSSLIGDQEVQHRDGIVDERGIKPQLDLGQQIESTYQSRQREGAWKVKSQGSKGESQKLISLSRSRIENQEVALSSSPVMSSRSPADKISSSDITTRIIPQGERRGITEDDVPIGEEGNVYQGKVTHLSREELSLSFQNQPVQEISNQRRIGQNVRTASSTSIPVDDPPRVFPWKSDIRSRAFSIVEAAMRSPSSSFSGEADYTSRSPSGATNNADSIGLYSLSGLGDDISRDDLRRKPTGIQMGNQYEISREVSSEHQPIVPQGEAVSIPTGNTSPVRHLVRFVQLDGDLLPPLKEMGFLLHRSGLHGCSRAEALFSRGLSTGEKSFAPPLCSDRSGPRVCTEGIIPQSEIKKQAAYGARRPPFILPLKEWAFPAGVRKGLNINAINPDFSHEPDHPSPRIALYGDNSMVLITISSSSAEDSSIHPRSDEVGGVQAPPYFILSREGMESDPDPAYHTGLARRATQDGGGSSSTAGGNPDVIPGAPEKRLEAGRWEDQAVRGVKRKAEIIFKNAVIHPGSDLKEGVHTPAVSVEGRIDGMRTGGQVFPTVDITDLKSSSLSFPARARIISSELPPDQDIQGDRISDGRKVSKPQLNPDSPIRRAPLGEKAHTEMQQRSGNNSIVSTFSHGEPQEGKLGKPDFVHRPADSDLLNPRDSLPADEAKMRSSYMKVPNPAPSHHQEYRFDFDSSLSSVHQTELGSSSAERSDQGRSDISSGSPARLYEGMSVKGNGGEKNIPLPSYPSPSYREVDIAVRFDRQGERVEVRDIDEGVADEIARQWQHTVGGTEYRLEVGDRPEAGRISNELGGMISNEVNRLKAENPILEGRIVTVSSIRVKLRPEHLGRMEIKVIKKGEEISAIIKVEDNSVRRLLHQIAPQIRQNLEEHGIKMGQVEVRSFNPSFSGGFGSWMGNGRRFQQPGYPSYTAAVGQDSNLSHELEGEMEENSGVNLRA